MIQDRPVRTAKFYSESSMQTTTLVVNGDPNRTAGLLVSVQNERELLMALRAGVRWIDVKDPSRGALGRPAIDVATGIRRTMTIENTEELHFSIALGELNETPLDELIRYAGWFVDGTVFKIALSGCRDRTDWPGLATTLAKGIGAPKRLILVHYADANRAAAPSWCEVLTSATELGSEYLLIDTWGKDGSCLLDFYSFERLQSIIAEANALGFRVAIAGSLPLEGLRKLANVGADWIGVRGAVCEGPLRTGPICETKVRTAFTELAKPFADHLVLQAPCSSQKLQSNGVEVHL
jgi:uncharacterized protein (UPF0264 family)